MANNVGMAAQLAGQSLRFGWYFALNRALDWRTDQLGKTPRYKPTRPVPSLQELLADQAQLLMSDALAVREGLYPPMDDDAASPLGHLGARAADVCRPAGSLCEAGGERCHHSQGGGGGRRRARRTTRRISTSRPAAI